MSDSVEIEYLIHLGYQVCHELEHFTRYSNGKYHIDKFGDSGLYNVRGELRSVSYNELLKYIGHEPNEHKLWKRSQTIKKILKND